MTLFFFQVCADIDARLQQSPVMVTQLAALRRRLSAHDVDINRCDLSRVKHCCQKQFCVNEDVFKSLNDLFLKHPEKFVERADTNMLLRCFSVEHGRELGAIIVATIIIVANSLFQC